MRIKVVIAASVMLFATANSRAEASNACILKATESLPRISGLVIKKTGTRPVPAEILAKWKGQTRPIIVDVDIVATGAEETYSYLCALTKGSAYVRRVMSQQAGCRQLLQRPAHQRIATDTERNNVAAYGVFSGTHTGPGGPCEPTGKKTISDYVYVMQFTGDEISHMMKIWHSGMALKELGWA